MSENDAAPVSHQKQPHQNATNAIEIEQKSSKINEPDLYPPAHNGPVAGSSPAGPTSDYQELATFLKADYLVPPLPCGRGETG